MRKLIHYSRAFLQINKWYVDAHSSENEATGCKVFNIGLVNYWSNYQKNSNEKSKYLQWRKLVNGDFYELCHLLPVEILELCKDDARWREFSASQVMQPSQPHRKTKLKMRRTL